MGFISKEVNLPHQMLLGCSCFWGGGRVWALKPLRFCHFHIISIDCVIVQVFIRRAFLWHSLTADSLVLSTLQSLNPLFLHVPWLLMKELCCRCSHLQWVSHKYFISTLCPVVLFHWKEQAFNEDWELSHLWI